jgi:hypothetical protein
MPLASHMFSTVRVVQDKHGGAIGFKHALMLKSPARRGGAGRGGAGPGVQGVAGVVSRSMSSLAAVSLSARASRL